MGSRPYQATGVILPQASSWRQAGAVPLSPSSVAAERRASARPMAGATWERSNCLGCQGCLVYFLVLDRLGLPGRPMLQHSIENRHQLMHTRRQSDFFDFPCSEQPLIQGFDLRMKTG